MDPLLIEVFTAQDCPRCAGVTTMLGRVAEDFGVDIRLRLVDVLEEIDYAVELGILMTPAVAINGKLEFSVPPSERKLRRTLARYLDPGR